MAMNLPNNPVPLLEPLDVWTRLMHCTGDVAAKDGGPLLDKDADVLHMGVEWVDGHRGVLNHNLAWASRRDGGITDFEVIACLGEPRGLVGCHLVL
jgi:hypothetical protein